MPICKNCHSRIDKFNKDRCPICGVEFPFEGVSSDTIEITTALDVDNMDYKPRKRKTMFLLSALLGFTGAPYFYIYKKVPGIISLLASIVFIVVGGVILGHFVPSIGIGFGLLIFLALSVFIHFIIGIFTYITPNLKDGRGDFII